jgi:ABC-type molybdate transport system substrate-binding protein
LHDAITYPIAQIAGRGDETGARRARAFLAGPEAAALFRAQGFMVLTE